MPRTKRTIAVARGSMLAFAALCMTLVVDQAASGRWFCEYVFELPSLGVFANSADTDTGSVLPLHLGDNPLLP